MQHLKRTVVDDAGKLDECECLHCGRRFNVNGPPRSNSLGNGTKQAQVHLQQAHGIEFPEFGKTMQYDKKKTKEYRAIIKADKVHFTKRQRSLLEDL